MVRLEVLGLVRDARPRADERHVAAQDVDQLRQLVEARLAQPAAERVTASAAVELVEAVRRSASPSRSSSLGCTRGARASSVSTFIVRNLSAVNSRMSMPEPRLAEEDRAGRVALDRATRCRRRAARSAASSERRADDVDRRASRSREERESRAGGRPTSGRPSIVWISTLGPDDLEEARDDVDLDVELAQRADERRASRSCGSFENATIDALDVEQRARARAARRARPSTCTCSSSARRSLRLRRRRSRRG